MKNKKNYILAAILLFAALVRLYNLEARDIWYDEALDIVQSERGILQILRDVQTPLHYIIINIFLLFGKSTFVLGMPSVVFGVLSVYLVFQIAKKTYGLSIAAVASLLASASPMLIEFSQQILHYSYFVFFSLLTLYFYLDILEWVYGSKKNIKSIILFVFATTCNILTHPSSLLVLFIQAIYLIYWMITDRKVIKYAKKNYFLVTVSIIIIAIVIFGIKGEYLKTLSSFSFDLDRPIQIGYSLEGKLGSNRLIFNKDFFVASFGWYGIGYGFRNWVYILFATLGIAYLIGKKDRNLYFYLFWICMPFVTLYLFRPEHWFEEKYFIFIIPVYLILVSAGVHYIFKNKIYIVLSTVALLSLSIAPNRNRTIYGFRRDDHQNYSWNQAIKYMKLFVGKDDLIVAPNGESAFFNFYLDKKSQNIRWIEEKDILSLSSLEYQKLVDAKFNIYFASIPDLKDLFISSVVKSQYLAKRGGFNIYKINFLKSFNLKITPDNSGKIEYYEDFRTARYIADSSEVSNFSSSYYGNYNVNATYGYYNLSPIEFGPSTIKYNLDLSEVGTKKMYLYPKFTLCSGSSIEIYTTEAEKTKKIYNLTSSTNSFYYPEIILIDKVHSHDLSMKIILDNSMCKDGGVISSIKSILITDTKTKSGAMIGGLGYSSNLEIIRSNSWLYDSVVNTGWDQSLDGVLFNRLGSGSDYPLAYKFVLDRNILIKKLKIRTYTYNKNVLKVFISTDNMNWEKVIEILDNEKKDREIDVSKFNTNSNNQIFIKFECLLGGPTCQVRDFTIETEKK